MTYRSLLGALTLGLAALAQTGHADDHGAPVVVELFTSQGCSSCPPADELLHKLSRRDDVIALALHVDYWDYIGWKDQFALPGHTERQKGYARVAGRRTIYTPQMIINGSDHVVGTHPMDVSELIALHEDRDLAVDLRVERSGQGVSITARPVRGISATLDVTLVQYEPEARVDITRGENAGRVLSYSNIVREWHDLGEWDGTGEWETEVDLSPPAVVLIQEAGFGAILAAQDIR